MVTPGDPSRIFSATQNVVARPDTRRSPGKQERRHAEQRIAHPPPRFAEDRNRSQEAQSRLKDSRIQTRHLTTVALRKSRDQPSVSVFLQGPMYRIQLRWLILSAMTALSLLVYAVTLQAGYRTLRQQLLDQALDANQASATRLAQGADTLLETVQAQLAYSANLLAGGLARPEEESERLKRQTGTFASIWIVQADGRALAGTPPQQASAGMTQGPAGSPAVPERRRPLIEILDTSEHGNPVIAVTQPLQAPDGRYQGCVGGALELTGGLFHARPEGRDATHVYLLDRAGRPLHPHAANLPAVALAEAARGGLSGPGSVTDAQGASWLAGYAPLRSAGLSVVILQPAETALQPLSGLMLRMVERTFPLVLLALMASAWLSGWIARPLRQLAITAQHWESHLAQERIEQVRTGYFEAEQLRQAMLDGLGRLHRRLRELNRESITDPLTGLTNRRGKRLALTEWETRQRPFAVIVVDIDHFKQVNDTHGHAVGDQVIQFAGQLMRRVSRSDDLLCRVGGEEFMLLLPDTPLKTAAQIAERLRRCFAQEPSPTGEPISISAGVARWHGGGSLSSALTRADEALYQAKRSGRNRIVTGEPS